MAENSPDLKQKMRGFNLLSLKSRSSRKNKSQQPPGCSSGSASDSGDSPAIPRRYTTYPPVPDSGGAVEAEVGVSDFLLPLSCCAC